MAGVNVRRMAVLRDLIANERRRRRSSFGQLAVVIHRRRKMLAMCFAIVFLFLSRKVATESNRAKRSCRRLGRNGGWWHRVWHTYSDQRFKQNFRVSRATFGFILEKIRGRLTREHLVEEPVSPECRLALCLYRLGRGDYFHTIAEMTGLGVSTVSTIVHEVNDAIVSLLWKDTVESLSPSEASTFQEKMVDMGQMWQFPYAWAALDGCHIPIKCPPGGKMAAKEYHNFKNFYSVVLMALVDAKYRFVWASCGFPGNSHDSIIFKSTDIYAQLRDGSYLPGFTQQEENVCIPPVILADSAFHLERFLMKPYTNAVLTPKQHYYNYRLSRARMVAEGAFGQLKGRWRVLLNTCEGGHFQSKLATLACVVLHNVCIQQK